MRFVETNVTFERVFIIYSYLQMSFILRFHVFVNTLPLLNMVLAAERRVEHLA